ncbi:MAG: OmpA family protein [Bacteroidia bacterium]
MNTVFTRFLGLLLALCLTASLAFSQNSEHRWGLGAGLSMRDFNAWPNFDLSNTDIVPGFQLQLNRYLSDNFDIGAQSSFQPMPFARGTAYENLWDSDLLLKWKLANGDYSERMTKLVPMVMAGPGLAFAGSGDDRSANFNIPLGLGLRLTGGSPVSLDFQVLYKLGLGDLDNFVNANAAVNYAFGGGASKPDLPPPPPADSDGDGIADVNDDCPQEPGIAPTGCPDRDRDGVLDKDDKCPEVPGIVALQGCPEKSKDRDGDGIDDDKDECPDVAGLATFNGCPDTDGDGISDKKDDCPDVAGIAKFNGCPDTDGDGVKDGDDACPDVPGLVDLAGCPDRDGDGIRDGDDRCPDEAGVADMNGCPEIEEEVKEKLARIMKSVQFESGSNRLKKSSETVLDEIVSIMDEYSSYSLRISGHTDSQGDDGMNMTLSQDRASACLDYLATHGVVRERMTSSGYGETQPVSSNATSAGRAENRRVEFELFVP